MLVVSVITSTELDSASNCSRPPLKSQWFNNTKIHFLPLQSPIVGTEQHIHHPPCVCAIPWSSEGFSLASRSGKREGRGRGDRRVVRAMFKGLAWKGRTLLYIPVASTQVTWPHLTEGELWSSCVPRKNKPSVILC